jgi:hypothetical protein
MLRDLLVQAIAECAPLAARASAAGAAQRAALQPR